MIRISLLALLAAVALAAPASAQEQVSVAITKSERDHLWSKAPASIEGRATLADGQPAVGRMLIAESRPYPYTGEYVEQGKVLIGTDGRFEYTMRPVRNQQLRFRSPDGQVTQPLPVRVFHYSLDGTLKTLRDGRQRAREVANVPAGYRIARVYLYLCPRKAKRCTYLTRAKAKVDGQQMTATATFKPPSARSRYSVIFRYVPKAGWGDSTASERRKAKKSIPA